MCDRRDLRGAEDVVAAAEAGDGDREGANGRRKSGTPPGDRAGDRAGERDGERHVAPT